MNNTDKTSFSNKAIIPSQNSLNPVIVDEKRDLLKKVMNYIFRTNEFIHNLQHNRIDPKINYVFRVLEDFAILNNRGRVYQELFRSKNSDELKNLIENLELHFKDAYSTKSWLLALNLGNDEHYESFLKNSKKIYYFALNIIFCKNLAIINNANNFLHVHIYNELTKLIRNDDFTAKDFASTFKNIFEMTLEFIFKNNLTPEMQMDLKALFHILNLCKINLEDTSLLKYLSKSINEQNKASYDFVFHELIEAYNTLPSKFKIFENIIVPNINDNTFLNKKLLKVIKENQYVNENFKEIPFNIDFTLFKAVEKDEKENYLQKNPEVLLKWIKYPIHSFKEFKDKFKYLQNFYFNKFSTEEIINHKLYPLVMECLIYPNISDEDLIDFINSLKKYYASDIIQEIYSNSPYSNSIGNVLLKYPQEELKDFALLAVKQCGFKYETAKFIDNFDLFTHSERIDFLLSSPVKVIEEILTNYFDIFPFDLSTYEEIFLKFINSFKKNDIPAHIITKLFASIDQIADPNLSDEISQQYAMMLVREFHLETLSLIPRNLLNDTLCSKIYEYLKTTDCTLPNLPTLELFTYFKNYYSDNSTFLPSKFIQLPNELKMEIASYLDFESTKSLALTCNVNNQMFGGEYFYFKKNNEIFKRICAFLLSKTSSKIRIQFINNEIQNYLNQVHDNEIINQLDLKHDLTIEEQVQFLKIFQNFLSLKLFNNRNEWIMIDLDNLSSNSEIYDAFIRLIDQVIEMEIKEKIPDLDTLIKFLDIINIELPTVITNKLIENLFYSIDHFFRNKYSNLKDFSNIAQIFKEKKFFNLSFLEKFIFNWPSCCLPLYHIFFKASEKEMDIEFLKKFINNSPRHLESILEIDYPKNFEWRLNFIKDLDVFKSEHLDPVLKFLSVEGTDWIKDYIESIAEVNPLWFFKACMNKKYGLNLASLSIQKSIDLIDRIAKNVGYNRTIHNFIKARKLKISNEQIFCYGIHEDTDFTEFYNKFQVIQRAKPMNLSYENIKDLVDIYCNKITSKCTRYDVPLNFYFSLVNFNDEQKIELLSLILNKLGLNCLKIISKTSVYESCMRLNDEKLSEVIKNLITDSTNFNLIRNYVIDLIGEENSRNIAPTAKRKSRPKESKTLPPSKRTKK